MCLITEQSEPIITTKDIVGYKALTIFLNSPMQYFTYIQNKLYKTEIKKSINPMISDMRTQTLLEDKYGEIGCYMGAIEDWCKSNKLNHYGQGFHLVLGLCNAQQYILGTNYWELFKCTIPAGSKVYYDIAGNAISNQIIIGDRV